jgi:hypothetical protein
MTLNFVAEVWDALRNHIDFNERKEAADSLVNLLIENNYEADEIKESFRGEKEILTALKDYVSEHEQEEFEDDEEESDDDEW